MSFVNSENRLYVGNLPPDIRIEEIDDLFYKFGKIRFSNLKNRTDSPFAFVEFEDPQDAEDAVQARDGYDYDGHRLRVEFVRGNRLSRGAPKSIYRGPLPPRRSQYRVLVTGLPFTVSWKDLKDHMREVADVSYADIRRDGTGVVEFSSYEDMKHAIRKLDDSRFRTYEGEVAYIRLQEDRIDLPRSRSRSYSPERKRGNTSYPPAKRFRSPRRSPPRSTSRSIPRSPPAFRERVTPVGRPHKYRVLVSGLPLTGDWKDLKEYMREAGEVSYANVFKDGTGVVEYARREDMKYAVKKLDDSIFISREGEVSYIRVKEI